MNWYKKAQYAGYKMILWHASIPQFADMIVAQGAIKPDNTIATETGQSQAGWNMSPVGDLDYGDGVYLTKNKEMAIYYGVLRLQQEWEKIEDLEDLYSEEEYGYVGLFRVFVLNTGVLIPDERSKNPGMATAEEYLYTGNILSQPNPDAWFEGPEWIDKTSLLNAYVENKERISRELQGIDNSKSLSL